MGTTVLGDMLIVDLTHQKVRREPLTAEMADEFIGGRGLNAKLLWDHNDAGVDPLGPANTLIFGAGLLTKSSSRESATTDSGGDWIACSIWDASTPIC